MNAMMFLGIGEVIGGLVSGQISDAYGARVGIYFNLSLFIPAIASIICYLNLNSYNFIAYLMPLL
jgi:predicted MFS family arabinose efflux permease